MSDTPARHQHNRTRGRAGIDARYVAQPISGVAVKELKDELGVAPFERGKTDISVTPAGQRIVEQAQHVLEAVENIRLTANSRPTSCTDRCVSVPFIPSDRTCCPI